MTSFLDPVETLLEGEVPLLIVIEIIEISVLEDDEAA